MKSKFFILSFLCLSSVCGESSLFERKSLCKKYKQNKEWKSLSRLGSKLVRADQRDQMTDLYYDLGLAEYHLENYAIANHYFSLYLEKDKRTRFLDETIEYKRLIADQLAEGKLTHLFQMKLMPKLFTNKTLAAELYEEVASLRPLSLLAAESYYKKARLLIEERDYEEAIASFKKIIQRYPRLELSEKSYIEVLKVHVLQAEYPVKDPRIIEHAQLQLQKFKQAFPASTENHDVAEQLCDEIKENFAKELFDQAVIFDVKWKKKLSAAVYYQQILNEYPHTRTAKKALRSLHRIMKKDTSIARKIGYEIKEVS